MLRTLVFPVALVLLLQASAFSAGVSFSGVLYETPDTPNGVVSADLNRDGLPDLATASSVVSVFLATSPGHFGAR